MIVASKRRLIENIRTINILVLASLLILIVVSLFYINIKLDKGTANDKLQNEYLVFTNKELVSQNKRLIEQISDLRKRYRNSEAARMKAETKRDSVEQAQLVADWVRYQTVLQKQNRQANRMIANQSIVLDSIKAESRQYAANYSNLATYISKDEFAARLAQSANAKFLGRTLVRTERGTVEILISEDKIEAEILAIRPQCTFTARVIEQKGRVNGKKAEPYIIINMESKNPAVPSEERVVAYKSETVKLEKPAKVFNPVEMMKFKGLSLF